MRSSSSSSGGIFDVEGKRQRVSKLDEEAAQPDFWSNQERAQKILKERTRLDTQIAAMALGGGPTNTRPHISRTTVFRIGGFISLILISLMTNISGLRPHLRGHTRELLRDFPRQSGLRLIESARSRHQVLRAF